MSLNIIDDDEVTLPKDDITQPEVTQPEKTGRLEYHATIHDLPGDERPRERLRLYGPQALSTAELLAIILRVGTARDNALELAGKLLARYGGLTGLMNTDFNELSHEHGLGEAKCCQIKAALEIGKRLGRQQLDEKYQIKSPLDAANLLMVEMAYLDHEETEYARSQPTPRQEGATRTPHFSFP